MGLLSTIPANQPEWDAFTLAHGGGFLQSWRWMKFQESLGRETRRFRIDVADDDGKEEVIMQCAMIFHPLPFGLRYVYIPRGPVINLGSSNLDAERRTITTVRALEKKCAAEHVVFARIEWAFERLNGRISLADLERWGFIATKPVQPMDTTVIDLTQNEEALLAAMHGKTRYNIRVAERHGVTVRESNDVDLFWRMLHETAARDKFHTHSKEHYQKMFDVLSSKSDTGGLRVRLVFAEYNGKAVAGAIFAEFGGTMTYLHGASLAAHRNVMAPHLLHWSAIRDAKRAGFQRYDFWGVAPSDDPAHPWAGVTRFKNGFGGIHETMLGAWELPVNRFWYSVYRYVRGMRSRRL